MKAKIITITLISLFIFSCKNDKKAVKTIPKTEQKEEVHNHHENEAIVFNNGGKWKVTDNMMAHIARMNKNVDSFKGSSLKDYQDLSGKLIADINLLTANCTMTGQAHDELHKWLLPYIDLANEFTEVKTATQAEFKLKEIKKSFELLNTYFK